MMFGGGVTVPGMPIQAMDPEVIKQKHWDNLVYAAKAHAEAVQRGINFDGRDQLEGDRLVEDILRKGQTLDACILSCRMNGHTVEQIAAVENLHPAYVRELLASAEGHSPF